MKTQKFPLLIYRDEQFENETRAGIAQVYDSLVKLLDIWNTLDVGLCTDLWQLCTNVQKTYSNAFQSGIEVPETVGKYSISKDVFINMVEIPTPNNLFLAARAVRKLPCYGYQYLWNIQNGKIIQDDKAAEEVINSKNIYAQNEAQAELGKAVIEYVRLSNFIDKRFTEIEWQYLPAVPFSLTGRHFPLVAMLNLEVEQLRLILNKL